MSFQTVHEEQAHGVQVVGVNRTGHTVDFNIHTGKTTVKSDLGLSHDVIMQLVPPIAFQGYELYCDNYYSSRVIFVSMGSWQPAHFIQADEDCNVKCFHSRMPL